MKKTIYEMSFSAGKEYITIGTTQNLRCAIRTTRFNFHQHPGTRFGGWWKVQTTEGKIEAYGGKQYDSNGRGQNFRYYGEEMTDRYTKEMKETENITSLEKLEFYINTSNNWIINVDRIIRRNGWKRNETFIKSDTVGIICTDRKNRKALYIEPTGKAITRDTIDITDRLNTILEDDKQWFGGVSYRGETLGEFLTEVKLDPKNTTIEEVNKILKENGIETITN